jgi:hypothetical protein
MIVFSFIVFVIAFCTVVSFIIKITDGRRTVSGWDVVIPIVAIFVLVKFANFRGLFGTTWMSILLLILAIGGSLMATSDGRLTVDDQMTIFIGVVSFILLMAFGNITHWFLLLLFVIGTIICVLAFWQEPGIAVAGLGIECLLLFLRFMNWGKLLGSIGSLLLTILKIAVPIVLVAGIAFLAYRSRAHILNHFEQIKASWHKYDDEDEPPTDEFKE